MEMLLYVVALSVVRLLQALPLPLVAFLGRRGGALAYWLDARHRRVTVGNLTLAFGQEKQPAEIRALARENFRRIGENFVSAVKTASMGLPAVSRRVEVVGAHKISPVSGAAEAASRVFAIGHFGNFELYSWAARLVPGYHTTLTTYRALRQPRLDALLRSIREMSGCRLFERRQDGAELRKALLPSGVMVGLLSDQHAGRAGLWLPFFGKNCSTLAAPAIFAQRYQMPLHPAICFRVGLARWRVEVGDEIPVFHDGVRRPLQDIMGEVNAAFETAIRRDPANWFWVHRRWKTEKVRPRAVSPADGEPSSQEPGSRGRESAPSLAEGYQRRLTSAATEHGPDPFLNSAIEPSPDAVKDPPRS